jgi:hypothetical protein
MKKQILLLTVLLSVVVLTNSFAQALPLVYNVENTGSDCPVPYMPVMGELANIPSLPDPFKWADGRARITYYSDWRYRRAEIGAQIQNYEIGTKPARPSDITASYSNGILTVNVTVNGKTLTLNSFVILPAGSGPFPAVIGMNSVSGSIPSTVFSSRNIAQIAFSHDQVTTYGAPNLSDPYYQLYPNFDLSNTGQYSAWAWGVSRIIDGLELVKDSLNIDLKHIAVTGCSYAGKMALFAGALDERVALTIAQESGGGGATSWRYSQSEPNGTVEKIDNTDYTWFMNSMNQFSGSNVSYLPEDHHELMALCAPRALLVTANPDYVWLSNPSCHVCSNACKQIYAALGIPDRFGYSIVGGHGHCMVPNSQIPEISAFVDKFLLGIDTVNTNIATTPYNINLTGWITWTAPVLSNGNSYFGKTALVFPANKQKDVDTNSVIFKWNKVKDAAKYIIQLSTDATFASIFVSDSTADTSKTFTRLTPNRVFYWRVQVKNAAGLAGLWSDVWNFTTTYPLPEKPQAGFYTTSPGRTDVVLLAWNKAKYADQYFVEIYDSPSMSSYFKQFSIKDTVKSVQGFTEGQKYYWRIRGSNTAGLGQWSDTWTFAALLSAPTDLTLQKTGTNQMTLDWTNNASHFDGCIIERKQNPQTDFSTLDTLKGNGNQYVDNNADESKTCYYRIRAYTQFTVSDYSNEVSYVVVGVNEGAKIPAEYSLSQNFPNPFNPATKIKFALPHSGMTKVAMYNLLGKEVRVLVNNNLAAGYYEINVDAAVYPSGVYFYRIQSGDFFNTKKMILAK